MKKILIVLLVIFLSFIFAFFAYQDIFRTNQPSMKSRENIAFGLINNCVNYVNKNISFFIAQNKIDSCSLLIQSYPANEMKIETYFFAKDKIAINVNYYKDLWIKYVPWQNEFYTRGKFQP
jgi:hypothetical protein